MHRYKHKLFTLQGVFLLTFLGLIFVLIGLFLIVQSATGSLLPHDIETLGMSTIQLSIFNEGKIVKFMFHDRVAFGGSLIALGILYIWLAKFPIKAGQPWAWWLYLLSGILGFISFLSYLSYGYLDAWHAIGTILLLPVFILGIYFSYSQLNGCKNIECLFKKNNFINLNTDYGIGNVSFLFTALGLFAAGIIIMIVGMSSVFVPQDFDYMKITSCGLEQINPKLIPLIAHDRASFGGGLAIIGLIIFFSTWCSKPNIILWKTLAIAISAGFFSAIGVHFAIGYLDFWHIAPAYFGWVVFCIGLYLTYQKYKEKE